MIVKNIKSKVTLLNVIMSLLLQIVTLISGFIIPRLILVNFGSNVNGLISSLNQFLSYITLIEGGISGIITANLYKPLVNKDYDKVGDILKTSTDFYKKIGLVFAIYALFISIIYPFVFNTSFSFTYIFTLCLILSLNLFIQYMFSISIRNLLQADKKVYLISFVQIVIVILSIIFAVLVIYIYPNIHLLKLVSGLLFIIQPVVYGLYVKKKYPLKKEANINYDLLKQRWNGFAVNVAYFIHSCTDITILTIFTNLATVSIYSVYFLISSGLKSIINSIATGLNPSLGHLYAKNNLSDLNNMLDVYEYIINILVYSLFSIATLLIVPFVLLYTNGVNDANYNQPLFGVLLLVSEALYLIKLPHLNLAYVANKYKDLTIPSFIEAFINIAVSLLLVGKYGLVGVAIGTISAMMYRMIFHVWFTEKLIGRSVKLFINKQIVFAITSFLGLLVCYLLLPLTIIDIGHWILYAIIYSILFASFMFLISIVFYKKELSFFIKYLKKINKK